MSETVLLYQFPGSDRIEDDLVEFAETLRAASPFSALEVMTRGWSSMKSDWSTGWISPGMLELRGLFRDLLPAGEWRLPAWFNILDPGGTIRSHDHIQAEFAMAYHVRGPGGLVLDYGDRSDFLPATPGRVVIFPGTLKHSVPGPVSSTRYSISINAHRLG